MPTKKHLTEDLAAAQVGDTGTALGQALNATILDTIEAPLEDKLDVTVAASTYARDRRQQVTTIGDSFAQAEKAGPDVAANDSPAAVSASSVWDWANGYLGGAFKRNTNLGVGGEMSSNILTRFPDALAQDTDWIAINAGTNDINQNATVASATANIGAMVDLARNAGKNVILFTVTASAAYPNSGNITKLGELNDWIRDQAYRSGVFVVDSWRVTVNRNTGLPAAGTTHDGLHLSTYGQERVGRELARVLAPFVAAPPTRVIAATDPRSAVSAGVLDFTGWGTGGDAKIAVATAKRDDSEGNELVITVTTGTTVFEGHSASANEGSGTGKWAVGDTIQASATLEWSNLTFPISGTGASVPIFTIRPFIGGAQQSAHAAAFPVSSAGYQALPHPFPASGTIRVVTNKLVIAEGITNLFLQAGWLGVNSGTIKVRDYALRKV